MTSGLVFYSELIVEIKDRIRQGQTRVALSANAEMIAMYWDIGRMIHYRQKKKGWGAGVIPRLAVDLKNELPEIKGFSERNIKRMLAFFREYPALAIVPQPEAQLNSVENPIEKVPQSVAQMPEMDSCTILQRLVVQISWGHNILLMEKIKDLPERRWYMQQTIEQGWSRDALATMIKNKAYGRQGKAVSKFAASLSFPQSELARQLIKDPYLFDFLTIGEKQRVTFILDRILKAVKNEGLPSSLILVSHWVLKVRCSS